MKDRHVFLNVPYDDGYERLFVALIAGCVGLGLTPRSVLEIPTDQNRVRRIWNVLRDCRFSIHDLSRVQLSGAGVRVPRFNMPFEAGLAVAFAQHANHQWRIFEQARYRLQQSLSDLNGFEPFIHGGTPAGILEALADAFLDIPADAEQLDRLFHLLLTYRRRFMGVRFFEPRPFRTLVRAAIEIRRARFSAAS